jgi:hypothetical protein
VADVDKAEDRAACAVETIPSLAFFSDRTFKKN